MFATCAHLYQNPSLTGTSSQTWSLAPVGFQHPDLVLGQSRGSRQGRFTSRRKKPAWRSASGKSHVFPLSFGQQSTSLHYCSQRMRAQDPPLSYLINRKKSAISSTEYHSAHKTLSNSGSGNTWLSLTFAQAHKLASPLKRSLGPPNTLALKCSLGPPNSPAP